MSKIGCIASSKNPKAINRQKDFQKKFQNKIIFFNELSEIKEYYKQNQFSILIVLGGDGFMIRALHVILQNNLDLKVYGINCGHLGFLLNEPRDEYDDLFEKIESANAISLNPLQIALKTKDQKTHKIFAINEISLLRQTYQSIHVDVFVNGVLRIPDLSGDGVLISTAAGSAAYNKSAGGTVLPIQSEMLCLTAINPFRPRAWKSAVLPDLVNFEFQLRDLRDRPALACADFNQYYFVYEIKAYINKNISYILLFDHDSDIKEKIMQEQFSFCF